MINFGRPVLPPLVMIFHTGDTDGSICLLRHGEVVGNRLQVRSAARLFRLDAHDESRVGELDDRRAFRGREAMRDRLRHGTEQPGRDHALDEL